MTDTDKALPAGTRLEEFVVEGFLGEGGFGVTYLALDESLGVRRALKEYLPRDWATRRRDGPVAPSTGSHEDYAWGLERFLAEARVLARLRHPHVVQVYRVFRARGTAYTDAAPFGFGPQTVDYLSWERQHGAGHEFAPCGKAQRAQGIGRLEAAGAWT